ncbi:MAG: SPOR domain-containing protein [Bacteroidia bacterium]
MFRGLITIIIILNATVFSSAQKINADTGKVEFVQETKIKDLLNKHIEVNSKAPIKGYRIKIHFGADKNKAKEVKAKFIAKFPDVPAYEKYDQPNFNIRVGDFRTKLEAYKFLKEVQTEFPSSFLVQDDIEMPELQKAEKK